MNIKRSRSNRLRAWLLLIPLLLACNFVSNQLSPAATTPEPTVLPAATAIPPTATPPATETPLPPAPPTPPISASPTNESPRIAPETSLLPAPLYFIGEPSGDRASQIMRLEADGRSLQQITDEPSGILDFDVSPVDGRLIYVSGNKLIETGPNGDNPIVKVDAGQIIVDPTRAPAAQARITQTIDRPRFSPDGSHIVFGLNGVNLILAGPATEYAILLPSDPYPDINDPNTVWPETPIRFYWPDSWSPDGRRLLVRFAYYPEAGGLILLDVPTGQWNVVTNSDGIECCDWAWSDDGENAFLASDQIAYGVPGLAQVSQATGGSLTIINGAPETPGVTGLPPSIQVFRAPFAAGDGRVFTFVAEGYQDEPLQPLFHMAVATIGLTQTTPLRSDETYPIETLWAPDGRGAVIANPGPSSAYPITGPLLWLPADDGPVVRLPASGGVLRWGPTGVLLPAEN